MPDSGADGRIRIYSVPTIANIGAPTVAELNAGLDLSNFMTPDGLIGFEPDTGDVDTSKINSTFSTTGVGRVAFSGTMLRMHKQTGTDVAYNTLVYGYQTNIVVRRDFPSATAWAVSQPVEVYPVECGEARNIAPEANSTHKYEVPTKVRVQPNIRATVA